MNFYLAIILIILIGEYALDFIVEALNIRNASGKLPQAFVGFYDGDKYRLSQEYLKETTRFNLTKDAAYLVLSVALIIFGGFNFIDRIARGFGRGDILTGLIFAGIVMLAVQLISIPSSAYRTFVIEEKYGFNKTNVRTFISDILKSLILKIIIGGAAFSGILWFFGAMGKFAWVYCWIGITLFQFLLVFIAPVIIMPLFNKFIPLEEGELKDAIFDYARSQKFSLKGIFKIDASRRSTKSNAFFTGFGKSRRIALFDTLIRKHTTEELVSVLAHEIGHYKKKHIIKNLTISIFTTGLMFFALSFFINNQGLFEAFRMEEASIYASLLFFGFLYAPINMLFSIFHNIISRKHEYEADRFVVDTYKKPEAFILALKKLSVDNLSNLTPHPLKVFLGYTHPPVLKRIENIEHLNSGR